MFCFVWLDLLENINSNFHFESDIRDVLVDYSEKDQKRFFKILLDIKEAVKQMTSEENMDIRFSLLFIFFMVFHIK